MAVGLQLAVSVDVPPGAMEAGLALRVQAGSVTGVRGVMELVLADQALTPAVLIAITLQTYGVPLVNPDTTIGERVPVPLIPPQSATKLRSVPVPIDPGVNATAILPFPAEPAPIVGAVGNMTTGEKVALIVQSPVTGLVVRVVVVAIPCCAIPHPRTSAVKPLLGVTT